MMQPDKLAPMFSSLLCDSIGITWGKLTLKARLTVNLPKYLQWKIYLMKTGEASLNIGPIRSIKYIIYMSSDHMLKSYLRMCHTNLSSCRWTIQRTRPTVQKWNSNRRQDLVAILHTARLLSLAAISLFSLYHIIRSILTCSKCRGKPARTKKYLNQMLWKSSRTVTPVRRRAWLHQSKPLL